MKITLTSAQYFPDVIVITFQKVLMNRSRSASIS